MKPPLARHILFFALALTIAAVIVVCLVPSVALAASDPMLLAGDAGRGVAQTQGPAKLVGVIALCMLPALLMIARARQTR